MQLLPKTGNHTKKNKIKIPFPAGRIGTLGTPGTTTGPGKNESKRTLTLML